MTSGPARRGGKRRGRRGGASSRRRESTTITTGRVREGPWQWRTFPVGFALSIGALVMGLLTLVAPGAFFAFLVTALFLTLFGFAHFFGRSLGEYRRARDIDDETY